MVFVPCARFAPAALQRRWKVIRKVTGRKRIVLTHVSTGSPLAPSSLAHVGGVRASAGIWF